MTFLTQKLLIFIVIISIVIVAIIYATPNKDKDAKLSCLMNELSEEDLYELAIKEGLDISDMSEESIQEILNRPLCKDVCLEQLEHSKQYPEEWFADEDLRDICNKAGLPLPK